MKLASLAHGAAGLLTLCYLSTAASLRSSNSAGAPAGKEGESLPPKVVDGYTDCAANSPESDHWWNRKASGHGPASAMPSWGPSSIKMPMRNVAICVPPKNGCTYWNALLMRMDANPHWNAADELARHDGRTQLDPSWEVHKSLNGMTVMLVRNPVARMLSAFLDKAQNTSGSYYAEMLSIYSFTPSGFQQFVTDMAPKISKQFTADSHWGRQTDMCSLPDGARWDFYLKVECRGLWAPSFFRKFNLGVFTDCGWGSDGKQPFIPNATASGAAEPTLIKGVQHDDPAGSHAHRADAVQKICKWYTRDSFRAVVQLFSLDIKRFGYEADTQRLSDYCKFPISDVLHLA